MKDKRIRDSVYRRIHWGPDEAKGDNGLARYFVYHPEYKEIVEGKKRYVIGRKGAGKTAILERLRLDAAAESLLFHRTLSLRKFPLRIVRDLRDKSMRDKSQFVPVWTFLIATEFARMVLQDVGASPTSVVSDIREFMKRNFPDESFGMAQTLTYLKERGAKVDVIPKWLNLSTKSSNEFFAEVHYQQCTEALIYQLEQIQSDSTYYLLIDNLDEGYRAGDSNFRLLLLALLRAVEDTSLQLQSIESAFRPVLVLRSDIFDRLEDSDLNKLDDYVVRLNWRSDLRDEYSLMSVVEARVKASGVTNGTWDSIAVDNDPKLPKAVDSLWKYTSNRTLERPRDLLKFLKICSKHVSGNKLSYSDVSSAEVEYSGWLYRETRDEIHAHLSIWKECLDCITRLGKGKFPADALCSELEKDHTIIRWLTENESSTDQIIKLLFDFSIVGNLSREGVWLFSYKDPDLPWTPGRDLIVHYGYHRKLRLQRRWI